MNNSFFYGHGNLLLIYLILSILFKVFAASATNGGGGCGGIFAPSLYLGCIAGFVFSHFSNEIELSLIHISRFPHRGAMMDVGRNFLPKEEVLKFLDLMAFRCV